jgi:hypothetical protein
MNQPNRERQARFDALLKRAKALGVGDEDGIKEIVAAAVDARLSDLQLDILIGAAARKTGISKKLLTEMVKKARADLKRRDEATPEAKADRTRKREAAAVAARIVRDAETTSL